ncbi:hypothetical protein ACVINW_000144 [Bradyrhizobium sp. USDA 4461]
MRGIPGNLVSLEGLFSAWNSRIFSANFRATSGGISSGFRVIGMPGR